MFRYNLFGLNTSDLNSYSELYALCFHKKPEPGYFSWKYSRNPAGNVIGFEAHAGQELSGFYGVIPEKYLINGKQVTIYQSMDTMTHPSYQKKGLFTTLADKTYAELRIREPESLIIGIPGSSSYHGFVNKLGWKNIHHFSYIFLNRYFFKLGSMFTSTDALSVREFSSFDIDGLEEFLSHYNKKGKLIKPFMTREFLNWRISESIFNSYKILCAYSDNSLAGIMIYRLTEEGRAFIEWVEYSNESNEKKILNSFCDFIFKSSKTNFIYTWEPLQQKALRNFKSTGFLKNPFASGPFSYKIPFIIHARTNQINTVNLENIKNYDLQPIIQD